MSEELEVLESIKRKYIHASSKTKFSRFTEYEQKQFETIENTLKDYKNLKEENKLLRASIENLDETYFETWLVCEELKKNSNYALMFIDNIYCLVDTKDNKFDVIDNYEINSKGIIENKKAKALEIIKDLIELHYDENRHYITLKNHETSLVIYPKEKCDLLKEVLL